jgi:hypothetical protein
MNPTNTDFLTPAERALAFVMEYGEYLASQDEWSMDDNFTATEQLHDLYCQIVGVS